MLLFTQIVVGFLVALILWAIPQALVLRKERMETRRRVFELKKKRAVELSKKRELAIKKEIETVIKSSLPWGDE